MYGSSRSIVAGFGVETSMWQRQTQPSAFSGTSESSAAGCGSWTMQTSQPRGELARVHLVVLRPRRPLLLGEVLRVALERVVHELRRVEELLAPVDHLPLDLEPDVAHQRHERVEDLRHAAAERGRAEVHDAAALQRLGQLADLLDERAADDVGVVGEALVGRARRLEHGAKPTRRRCAERALAELDLDLARLAVAVDLERDLLARARSGDSVGQVVRVLDRRRRRPS